MAKAALGAGDWVSPENLNVAPDLVGQALARPARRLAAMAIDLAAIALLSATLNGWLLLALAGLGFGQARAAAKGKKWPSAWVWAAVLVLALLGLQQAWRQAQDAHPTTASRQDDAEPSTAKEIADRIVELEAQLVEARAAASLTGVQRWRRQALVWLDEVGLRYTWALLYFSLLPHWWRGQTIGKRALGLRVVEITGKPMGVMLGLRRYGGYIAGMATGGLGFAQLLRDPNRQALHDKAAHTVVLDLNRPRQPAPIQPTQALSNNIASP